MVLCSPRPVPVALVLAGSNVTALGGGFGGVAAITGGGFPSVFGGWGCLDSIGFAFGKFATQLAYSAGGGALGVEGGGSRGNGLGGTGGGGGATRNSIRGPPCRRTNCAL